MARRAPDAGEYQPLAEVVAADLREQIFSGVLGAGDRILQEVVARQHGISRIPVREALKRLEADGLVTFVPHSGARVSKLDAETLTEIYLMRERLEPLAIARSATRLTLEQLDGLRQLTAEMESLDYLEVDRWLDLDRRFHFAIIEAADMPRLTRIVDEFWTRTQQYRRAFSRLSHKQLELSHAEHHLILDALERRDADDAERLLTTHIRRPRITLDTHVERSSRPDRIPPTVDGDAA